MVKNEMTPFIAVNGVKNHNSTLNLPKSSGFVKDFPKIPTGKIEGNTLVKRVKAKNFHHRFQAWGIAQETIENALEQGAEFLEFRIDDGERLRIPILTALNRGIRHQFKGWEPQVFVPIKFCRYSEPNALQGDSFGGGGHESLVRAHGFNNKCSNGGSSNPQLDLFAGGGLSA